MKSEKELFEKAKKIYHQYSESRYPKAIKAFQELLELYPNNIKGWSMLSTMQSSIHLYDDAIYSIGRAIELDKSDIKLLNQKIILLNRINYLEYRNSKFIDKKSGNEYTIQSFSNKEELLREIANTCEEQIKVVKEDYYNLGDILETKAAIQADLELWQAAIDTYNKAIEFYIKYEGGGSTDEVEHCLFSIAQVYEKQEDYAMAIKFYDKAMEAKYKEILLTHKARVLAKMNNIEESEQVYNDFIKIVNQKLENTLDSAYMFQIADVYSKRNLTKEAYDVLVSWESKVRDYKGLKERIEERKLELMN